MVTTTTTISSHTNPPHPAPLTSLLTESQVYRKATIARFENLSLAEQARQEHQMRRQHYQQHYQHRHQQQQQYQHQQYSQGRNSRPTSMYSTGHAASLAHTMGSPPRHHQHQHQHPRPRVLHQARHPHDHRLSMVSTSKGNISASRSANDLAWERHCYYQQQQMQEDALAERKRIEQHQMKSQRPLSTVEGLQVPNVASQVVRTSSMSRISSSSNVVVASASPGPIGRRAAAGATMAQSSTAAAAGLSRSVSTSAIGDAKARAAKKDKAMHRSSSKKNKESPSSSSPSSPTSETEPKASSTIDCKFLRLLRRSDSKLTKTTSANAQTKANTESPSGQQAQPIGNNDTPSKDQSTNVTNQHLESTPAAATTGLSRRRTLKDIGPSIRSLARRCSSRFSSTRPSSFAGSGSDPVISFSEGKVPAQRGSNSLSMTTSYLPLKISLGAVPRSLSPGPDGVIDLRQVAAAAQGQEQQKSPSSVSVKYFPPASSGSPSLSLKDLPQPQPEPEQRVPIHRRVTLFRSKTVSLSKASSKKIPAIHVETIDTTPTTVPIASAMADDTSKSSARANSLHNRSRKRESLRLANGHGLDFDISRSSNFSSNTPADARDAAAEEASAVERSTNDLESALPVTTGRLSDMDQQQKARRQIISLLAMGRKDRISAKTGHAMKPSPSPASSTISQLSPLALEAQEDLFADSASSSGGDGGEKKKEGEDGEEDPCERIAFMLVPKSRYEFQPLVVA
ncbi:hypothetical protein BGX23_011741 [Mortierella sp. AD031]|nr:hypothetical protein BGX23_011741 [Mortierella sp. AD031]